VSKSNGTSWNHSVHDCLNKYLRNAVNPEGLVSARPSLMTLG